MHPFSQEQFARLQKNAQYSIAKRNERLKQPTDEYTQGAYISLGGDLARMGRILYLQNKPVEEVRVYFRHAAESKAQSFRMAFDPEFERYLGDTPEQIKWGRVNELESISLMMYALVSGDIEYAAEVARWPRVIPNKKPRPVEVCSVVYGLRDILLGDWEGAEAHIDKTFAKYKRKRKEPDLKTKRYNSYTRILALSGILKEDDELFNQGLSGYLAWYQLYADEEADDDENSTEPYFAFNAIGLANLGIHYGRRVEITEAYPYFPRDMLIEPS